VGGAARINAWLAPAWSTQFDLSGEVVFPNKGSGGYSSNVSTQTLAGHLDWRDPSRGLLGLMVGLAGTNDYAGTGQDWSFFFGPEAQLYWGNFTFYAQGGLLRQLSGYYGPDYNDDYKMDNIWFAQLAGRYFWGPNTKLEGSVGYIDGGIWGTKYYGHDYDAKALTYSAEVEHRFDQSPLSVFGRFSGFTSDDYYVTGGSSSEYAGMLGVKVHFGSGTLLSEDRTGATLKTPDFSPLGWLRWAD
jgi:hypothetical protein